MKGAPLALRIATVIAGGAVFAIGGLVAMPDPVRAQDGSDMGARLPWDFPLPPRDSMLHPTGNPPNGEPPETKLGRAPTMALFAGGVPLIRNGEVFGAVAASGARAVQDEACAAAGAAAVADRL